MTNNFLEDLQWRYATKSFDSTTLTDEQLNYILEAGRLAASSYGLEPWKFLVIKNPELRTKLQAASWNQTQVTQSSHLIVLCARTDINETYVNNYQVALETNVGMPAGSLDGLGNMIRGSINYLTPEQIIEWNKKQVYIALGQMMSACATAKIDSCPMEGFDAKAYSDILGLEEKNLVATVVLPVGFRSPEDKTANYPKFRRSLDEISEII